MFYPFQFETRRILKYWSSLVLCSNLGPLGLGQFLPPKHHMNKLGRGLLADTKYQIIVPISDKKILKLVVLFLCSNLRPPGPSFDPQADHMNKLGRDSQDDAIYQL